MMTKSSRVVLAFGLIVVMAHAASAQRKPIGFVLQAEGNWRADDQPIRLGQALLAGSVIALSPETPLGTARSITVVFADGQRKVQLCSTRETCRFTLPPSLNGSTTLLSRLADVFNLIFGQPDRYVTVLSRGSSGGGELRDTIVRIESGKVDVTTMFRDVAPGKYLLTFRSVPMNGTTAGSALTLDAAWDQVAPLKLATVVGPGLYKVSLLPAASPNSAPAGPEAWVLVDRSPRYERLRTAFDQAAATVDSWGRDVPAGDRRLFLHAYLDLLAAQP